MCEVDTFFSVSLIGNIQVLIKVSLATSEQMASLSGDPTECCCAVLLTGDTVGNAEGSLVAEA